MDRLRLGHSARQFALALVMVAVATGATRVLLRIGDSGISPLFFAAVLASAWFGGVGSGLVATALSAVATMYLLRPESVVSPEQDSLLRLMIFTLVSLLTSSLHAATRRAEEASRRAKEAAESANAAKAKLLAMVGHELRTPLGSVLLGTELLEADPSVPPGAKEEVRMIRRNAELQTRLINDLLDTARWEKGKLRLQIQRLDLSEPLRHAIDALREDIKRKQIQMKVEMQADQAFIRGDPLRLEQIFWNLLRNAIKFTPQGGSITARIHIEGEYGVIELEDNGVGISPDKLEAIFEAFEQAGTTAIDHAGGLGLGLAVCKALVTAHDGTITAASEGKGHGAKFTVMLPVASDGVRNQAVVIGNANTETGS